MGRPPRSCALPPTGHRPDARGSAVYALTTRAWAATAAVVAVLVVTLSTSGCALPGPSALVEAQFVDASLPTRCAEEDNVHVPLLGDAIASFRIAAEHPPYIAAVTEERSAPDFSDCDMSNDPVYRFAPRTVVLHEDARLRIVGHTFATFWRPEVVDLRIGGRVEPGLHLVQVIRRGPPGDVEMLVLYPADGYWRAKPLPPPHLPDTAYGSSFLVGPIEERGRPMVALQRVDIEVGPAPATLTFRLAFADGRRGTLAIAEVNTTRIELAVAIDPPLPAGRPFAALRSMFVREDQADVALARHPADGPALLRAPILGFGGFRAASARFGRELPSNHNLGAPDTVFRDFRR
jgi:hypothetical protein